MRFGEIDSADLGARGWNRAATGVSLVDDDFLVEPGLVVVDWTILLYLYI